MVVDLSSAHLGKLISEPFNLGMLIFVLPLFGLLGLYIHNTPSTWKVIF